MGPPRPPSSLSGRGTGPPHTPKKGKVKNMKLTIELDTKRLSYDELTQLEGIIELLKGGKPPELTEKEIKLALVKAVSDAAKAGRPFTRTGKKDGIVNRRNDLSPELQSLGQKKILGHLSDLYKAGQLVWCQINGSQSKYLDVPTGPIAKTKVSR